MTPIAGIGHQATPRPVVLMIDDEPQQIDSVSEELGKFCSLYTASSAEAAAALLAARPYDVIISDHMMPGEQGLDFLVRMMEEKPKARRILMTGYTNPEFISRSIQIGDLSACLVKPLRASEFIAAIRSALGS